MYECNLLPRASVHGRFQPFHNEHLDYLRRAFGRAQFIYIGITRYRLTDLAEADMSVAKHRSELASNPLTYFERSEVIRESLLHDGFGCERFAFVPFPIESPDELPNFVPTSVLALTTRVDEWNDEKVDRLRRVGYEVEVLVRREPREVSGSTIRELMASGDESWKSMVPETVADILVAWDIPGRLRQLSLES